MISCKRQIAWENPVAYSFFHCGQAARCTVFPGQTTWAMVSLLEERIYPKPCTDGAYSNISPHIDHCDTVQGASGWSERILCLLSRSLVSELLPSPVIGGRLWFESLHITNTWSSWGTQFIILCAVTINYVPYADANQVKC